MSPIMGFSAMGMQIIGGWVEDGRAANNGRIDKPLLSLGISTRDNQSGFCSKPICARPSPF